MLFDRHVHYKCETHQTFVKVNDLKLEKKLKRRVEKRAEESRGNETRGEERREAEARRDMNQESKRKLLADHISVQQTCSFNL